MCADFRVDLHIVSSFKPVRRIMESISFDFNDYIYFVLNKSFPLKIVHG